MMTNNVHPHEINKFSALAERWWDTDGEFKTLHQINPLRLAFIQRHAQLRGRLIVDVGCGGGILTEALAGEGAETLGIDLSDELVDIADLHGLDVGSGARYQKISAEALAEQRPDGFDHVMCMEMLEHVPDPGSIIQACARLVKPGGKVFFSTLNRQPKAYWLAIVAAEYLLQMLPKGTHDFKTFIKPSELCQSARRAGLSLLDLTGIEYNPLRREFFLGKDVGVNYLAVFEKVR